MRCTMLNRLSGELRDIIYEHVLTPRDNTDINHLTGTFGPNHTVIKARSNSPGMLLVCKQVRAECIVPYLRFSSFKAPCSDLARTWLVSMPPHYHKHIQELCVDSMFTFWYRGRQLILNTLTEWQRSWFHDAGVQLGNGVLKARCRGPNNEMVAFGSMEELERKKTW